MWWREFGERQLGLVTCAQGVELVGKRCFFHAVEQGYLVRDRPGVYVIAGVPRSKERDLLSACLSADAVASHRSAAWMERFPSVASLRPEITTSPASRVRLAGVKAHRSTYLPPEHITIVEGIPCTSPARTAVDLSAVLGDDSVKRMLEDANHHGILSYADVVAVMRAVRVRGRRRVAHLAPILDHLLAVGDKSQSRGETWVVRTVVKAGMRRPTQQIWVVTKAGRYCIDVGWLPEKVGIDFDGWWAHGQTRSAFIGDRDRISELELAGWLMLPVTSATTASVLIDRVQRALAQRSPTSGHSVPPGRTECPEVGEGQGCVGEGYGS
jgi:hypothetical protein